MTWDKQLRQDAERSTLRLFSLLVSLRIIDAHYEDLKRLSMRIKHAE